VSLNSKAERGVCTRVLSLTRAAGARHFGPDLRAPLCGRGNLLYVSSLGARAPQAGETSTKVRGIGTTIRTCQKGSPIMNSAKRNACGPSAVTVRRYGQTIILEPQEPRIGGGSVSVTPSLWSEIVAATSAGPGPGSGGESGRHRAARLLRPAQCRRRRRLHGRIARSGDPRRGVLYRRGKRPRSGTRLARGPPRLRLLTSGGSWRTRFALGVFLAT
jgi:hypothetical protein